MRKIILASASPRRRELLAAAGVIFQVCAADGEEKITSDKPEEIVRELSEQKATAVALNFDMEEGTVVIGADTIVSYNNEILGKPVDESDAFKTLKMLQGNIHQVYTGVTVLIKKNGKWEDISFSESTDVSFYPVSDEEIRTYIASGEPMDKAGSYGIQGGFGIYVKEIRGEYLSGFLKEDHIKPVITLVIHFGAEEWDGPLSLHEMMPIRDMEILSYVENYRIHLIDPAKLTEEELNKFSTSMREVMGYIKYSNNKEKLLDFLRTDTHKSIEMNAARVIKTITKTPIKISEEKEGIEMCQAIEELIAESEARGEVRGKAEGMIEMCLEMNIPKKGIIKRLQDKLNISMQQADEYFRMYGTKND